MAFLKNENSNIFPLWKVKTQYFADSIEWCPHFPNQNIFVCGMYQLDEKEVNWENRQKRIGAIYLFQIDFKHLEKYMCLQTLPVSGILDMKWCPYKISACSVLCTAMADGNIGLYYLIKNDLSENKLQLNPIFSIEEIPSFPDMVLSLDCNLGKEISTENYIVVSESNGTIDLLQLTESNLKILNTCSAHKYQAWITCFNYHDDHVIYSGGDDGFFKGWDSRTDMKKPLFVNKSHLMGVTSLHSSKKNEYSLVSGSYDEVIRLWDTRKVIEPLTETKVDGGIWRLKWQPYTEKHLLAACNENGVKILKMQIEAAPSMDIVASNNFHSSLAYGADWCWFTYDCLKENNLTETDGLNSFKNQHIIASCSFYDRYLCVWKTILEE